MIVARWLKEGKLCTGGLAEIPASPESMIWVDVTRPDEATLTTLAKRFNLPPLAVEDCLDSSERPKIDTYENLSFVVWLVPYLADDGRLGSHELDVFLGKKHLLTIHMADIDAIVRVVPMAVDMLSQGAEWALHAILDYAADSIVPVVERLSDDLNELEELFFSQALPQDQQRLYRTRRALVELHRIVTPERDVVRSLARLEAFVEPEAYMYFQDIGDHLARVTDEIDIYREVANGTMDIYLSAQSNRMNAIMKTLTIVATIFMPLTFITGVYGMNFSHMPGLEWQYGFWAVLGVMVLVAFGMMVVFRRNKWW